MNQLSSITPLEIILIGFAAVGVFLFFRACWRNIKRSRQHLSVALLTLMMSLTAQTAWADDVMYVIATELSANITITQRNEAGNTSNLSVKNVKLTFYYGERPTSYAEGSEVWSQRTESFGGSCIFDVPTDVPTSTYDHYPAWFVNSSKNAAKRHEAVTQISFDASFADALPKSTAYWFYYMENLTSNYIDFTNLNTSSTKSMNHMFYGCKSIQNLDLSGWNVANVTDMGYMFSGCSNLNKIKLIGWKVTRLQNANSMFNGCKKLTYIYCDGNWDKNSLTQSSSMFNNCTSLPGYKSTNVTKKKAKPQPDGYFTSTGLTLNVSDGYYEIADEQDLIDFSNYVSASNENTCAGLTFKMTADLDFTDKPDSFHDNNGIGSGNFRPVGFRTGAENTAFKGHFDGNGHSITGLRFDYGNDRSKVGLFISIAGGVVEGVTLVNPTFRAVDVGGIANNISDATVRNCAIVGGSITGSDGIGGIVGQVGIGTISGCAVIGTTISNGSYAGVFVGQNLVHDNYNSCTISNCNYYNPTVANMCSGVTYTDGGGNQQVYQVTLGEGITAASPAFAYGNKAYYAEDATVTLGTNRTGYVASGYQSNDVTITDGSFTMPASDVSINANWADPNDISVNAAVDEYTIKTAAGWGVFCDLLEGGTSFTGKTVYLDKDISVTRMAGSSSHKFTGTFDGDGKTLTVSYGTEAAPVSEEYAAPFRFVDGATIQNLHVEGSIISTVRRAAGVIGETGDNTSHITNCVSSSTISGGNFTGGFSIGGNVEIDGCVYNGKINGSGNSGGFVGYSQPTLKITNCLFAPQSGSSISGGTFYYNGGGNITPVNSYYTQKLGTAQGTQANYLLSEDEAVPSKLDGTVVFRREFNGGKASTICLPFEYEPAKTDGTYYSFEGIKLEGDEYVATMTAAETPLKPNTPYVFMPATTDTYVPVLYHGMAAYDARNLTTTSGDWTFRGTYEQLKYGSNLDGHVYGFASRDKEVDGVNVAAGEFVKAKDGAGVKPMRCYLTYKDNQEFVGARAVTRGIEENLPQSITVKFVGANGETTGIATLNTLTGEIITDDAWYTLSGTRLPGKPSQRGIYINKGNKVVIR